MKKSLPSPGRAPFGEMPKPERPWQWVAMDVTGPFPRTNRGNRYILVVTCGFSKWTEAFALPDQTAGTIAKVLVEELICRHGCPEVIHSDQGRNFEASLIREICKRLNIKKSRTTPYHAQGNGQTERFNHTLCNMLSMYVQQDQRDWDDRLPFVMLAYRTSVNETTKETPFYLFYGRRARLPVDVACGGSAPMNNQDGYEISMARSWSQAQVRVRENIAKQAEKRRERQSSIVQQFSYQVGDWVWLYKPVKRVGRSPKLELSWHGPYEVVTVLKEGITYRIKLIEKPKYRQVVHHDRLKPCHRREEQREAEVPKGKPAGVGLRDPEVDGHQLQVPAWSSEPEFYETHQDLSDLGFGGVASDQLSQRPAEVTPGDEPEVGSPRAEAFPDDVSVVDPVPGAGVAPGIVPGQFSMGPAEMIPEQSDERPAMVGEQFEPTLGVGRETGVRKSGRVRKAPDRLNL